MSHFESSFIPKPKGSFLTLGLPQLTAGSYGWKLGRMEERGKLYKTKLYCFKGNGLGCTRSMHAPKVLAIGCSGLSTLEEEEEYCCLKMEVGEGDPADPWVSQTAVDMTRLNTTFYVCSLASRTFHIGTRAASHGGGGVNTLSGWLSPVLGQHPSSETPNSFGCCYLFWRAPSISLFHGAFLRGCLAWQSPGVGRSPAYQLS